MTQYTHQKMQEHLRDRYQLSERYIRELMNSAMQNISASAIVQLPTGGHRLLVFLGRDKFELRR